MKVRRCYNEGGGWRWSGCSRTFGVYNDNGGDSGGDNYVWEGEFFATIDNDACV